MLGWSLMDLARAASVSPAAVHGIEGRYPRPVTAGIEGAIRVALETAGVRFLNTGDGFVGVTAPSR